MKNNRMHELGKSRVANIRMSEICNSTVMGILALWSFWISTSLLIRFIQ